MSDKAYYNSPVGRLVLVSEDDALKAVLFDASIDRFESVCNCRGDIPVLRDAADWLDRYFAGEAADPKELRLAPHGSSFDLEVWNLLCRIPYGKTVTYGDLAVDVAKRRGGKMSAQAIGGAVGRNPLPVIIPCHRVVGAASKPGGYSGGIDKKLALLETEGIDTSVFIVPKK